MSTHIDEISLAHEADAAWLIAMYLDIYGGDPGPEGAVVSRQVQQAAALRMIGELAEALDEKTKEILQREIAPLLEKFPMNAVAGVVAGERLRAIGFHVTEHPEGYVHADPMTGNNRPRMYCFRFRGQTYCTVVPSPGPERIQ